MVKLCFAKNTKFCEKVCEIRTKIFAFFICVNWNTEIIVLMKNASWIEGDIKVILFPCLLEHTVPIQGQR